jgi:hypothetical protein
VKWPSWFGSKSAPASHAAPPPSAKEDHRVVELRRLRDSERKLRRRLSEAAAERDAAVAARNEEVLRAAKLRRESDALRQERDDLALRLSVAMSAAASAESQAQTLRRW